MGFGDTIIFNGQYPPTHRYDNPGTYTVSLKVEDNNGMPLKPKKIILEYSEIKIRKSFPDYFIIEGKIH